MKLTSATTVNKPPQEVYDFWHRLENLVTSSTKQYGVTASPERAQLGRAAR